MRKYIFSLCLFLMSNFVFGQFVPKGSARFVKAPDPTYSYTIKGNKINFSSDYSHVFIRFNKPPTKDRIAVFIKNNPQFIPVDSLCKVKTSTSRLFAINTMLCEDASSVIKKLQAINTKKNTDTSQLQVVSSYPVLYYKNIPFFVDNTINVELAPTADAKAITSKVNKKYKVLLKNIFDLVDKKIVVLEVSDRTNIFSIINYINDNCQSEAKCAEPNFVLVKRSLLSVNDPLHYNQWFPNRIGLSHAWDVSTGDNSVIAVIEPDGIDTDQPDFDMGKCVAPYDFENNDNDPSIDYHNTSEYFPHGNCVAGIIGAYVNNGRGIAGIGYNTKVMPIRAGSSGNVSSDIAALEYIIRKSNDYNVVALNCSFDYPVQNDVPELLRASYESVRTLARRGKGLVVVAAIGNDNSTSTEVYPAHYSNVVGVGASNRDDQRWAKDGNIASNYGANLDVMAPGDLITTIGYIPPECKYSHSNYCMSFNEFETVSGTSIAAPIVSAIVGLMASANSELTGEQLAYVIQTTCDKPNANGWYDYRNNPDHPLSTWYTEMGYGRVNAHKAVDAARTAFPPIVINKSTCTADFDFSMIPPITITCSVKKSNDKSDLKRSYTFELRTLAKQDDRVVELKRETITALNNQDRVEIAHQYEIPKGLYPGTWEIVFEARIDQYTVTHSISFVVPEFRADITYKNYTVEYLGETTSQPIRVRYKIKNQGNTPTGKFDVYTYVVEKNWDEHDDYYIDCPDVYFVDNINPGEEVAIDRDFRRPDSQTIEDWIVYVSLDECKQSENANCDVFYGVVSEADETNNICQAPLHIPKYNADVVITAFSAKFGCLTNDSIPLEYSYTIKNTGTSIAKYIFNSGDLNTLDGETIRCFSWTHVSPLFPGCDTSYSGRVMLPVSLFNQSQYNAVITTDYHNSVDETNENNNKKTIRLIPFDIDLAPKNAKLWMIDRKETNQWRFSFTADIENKKTQCSGMFKVLCRIKNSQDNSLVDLGYFWSRLDGNSSTGICYSVDLNYNQVPPGYKYCLELFVDFDHKVRETNESNNICTSAAEVYIPGPDLTISGSTAEMHLIGSDKYVLVNFGVRNVGDKVCEPFTVGFKLFNDNYESTIATYSNQEELAVGATKNIWQFLKVPPDAPEQKFTFRVWADMVGAVTEINEGNNCYSHQLAILPDLTIEEDSVVFCQIGQAKFVVVSFKVKNQGVLDAARSKVKFFIYNGIDNKETLGYYTLEGLKAGKSTDKIWQAFSIPQGTRGGDQYVFIQADCENDIVEGDEYNNMEYQCISLPGPDLIFEMKGIFPNSARPGDQIISRCILKNRGEEDALINYEPGDYLNVNWAMYYLSKNAALGSDDVFLDYFDAGNIAAGATLEKWKVINIPGDVDPGRYYILFVADLFDAIMENSEYNNVAAEPILITNDSRKSTYLNDENNNQISDEESIKIYPNPTYNKVDIECLDKHKVIIEINIINQLGKNILNVKENIYNNNKIQLDLSNFTPGVYTVQIITNFGVEKSKLVLLK